MLLSERLRNYMLETETTVTALAKLLHVGTVTLNKVLYENIYNPVTARKIATTLGSEYDEYIIRNVCKHCGKVFDANLGSAEYCSTKCANAYHRNLQKAYNAPAIVASCNGNDKIAEEARIAKKHNTSYGRYEAFKEAGWLHLLEQKNPVY